MNSSTAFLTQGSPCIHKGIFLGITTFVCQRITSDHCNHRRAQRSNLLQMRNGSEEETTRENPLFERNRLMNDDDFIVDIEDDEVDSDGESDLIDVSDTNKRKKVRASIERLVDEITQEPSTTFTSDANNQPPIEEDETTVLARTAAIAADQRKAEDIRVLRISKLSYVASFLVIATGKNTPQLRAIANLVEGEMKEKHNMLPKRVDGVANSGWILLDYGDLLVNVFSPAQRQNYNLEGLWRRAEELDISDCLMQSPEKESDPEDSRSLDDWLSG